MSMALDHLDSLAAKTYDGFLVRKDLVRQYARQYPVPTYVVEFLLGRYCASVNEAEIAEGLAIVEQQLKDRTVRTGEEELFKARAKEEGVPNAQEGLTAAVAALEAYRERIRPITEEATYPHQVAQLLELRRVSDVLREGRQIAAEGVRVPA